MKTITNRSTVVLVLLVTTILSVALLSFFAFMLPLTMFCRRSNLEFVLYCLFVFWQLLFVVISLRMFRFKELSRRISIILAFLVLATFFSYMTAAGMARGLSLGQFISGISLEDLAFLTLLTLYIYFIARPGIGIYFK